MSRTLARPSWGARAVLLAAVSWLAAGGAADASAVTDSADFPAPGQPALPGEVSYWGPFPDQSDSVSARFDNRGRPGWEYVFLAPYTVVKAPFWAVGTGLVYTADWLAGQRWARTVVKGLTGFRGPFGGWVRSSVALGGLDRFGFGFSFDHESVGGSPHNRANLRLKWSLYGNQKYTFGLMLGRDGPNVLQVGAGYRLRRNARYFGVGPRTVDADESWYSEEKIWGGAGLAHRFGAGFAVTAAGIYSRLDNGEPNERLSPPLSEKFADDLPHGWGVPTEGVDWVLSLRHDSTDETGRPQRGGIQILRAVYFTSLDDSDLAYWDYRLELEQYLPLWFEDRSLALRAYISWLDDVRAGPVHFQRLLINDDPDQFRGFNDFRWRDRGITAFTAEYRWPVWLLSALGGPGVDAYLFTDIGQVFAELEQIKGDNLTYSYGGGLRFVGRDGGFGARLEIGVSDEDVVFRLTGEQIFQFVKGGVYYGRDPVPAR